ncbi:MAG: hypothetical protein QW478_13575 [Candidatus Micrarchaeaceae archaeon]
MHIAKKVKAKVRIGLLKMRLSRFKKKIKEGKKIVLKIKTLKKLVLIYNSMKEVKRLG